MITEKEYIAKVDSAHRKKFAQFFTPEQISDFMATWILGAQKENMDILEPAFGLGVFSRSLYKLKPAIRVVGYDIDPTILKYAKDNFDKLPIDLTLINENYITASWSERFDGIICNPPYLKFHDYDNSRLVPIVNERLRAHLNGFTNIYSLFLLKSIFQMREGGRMAYVVPSEFLNSDYGVEVKRILIESGVLKSIIIVDFNKCAFDDAITTACIVLCEKGARSDKVNFSIINDVSTLSSSFAICHSLRVEQLDPKVKWRQYYEESNSSKFHHLVPFLTFARVSRGIATGSNGFFTFKMSKIDSFNLPEDCFRPCICHAVDVPKLIFNKEDFQILSNSDKTVYLFNGCAYGSNPNVVNYIRLGEKAGVNKKYLTASRNPWYSLENRPPSPIWVSVFNRNGLRFVRNVAGVYNLTTFHCVYNNGEIDTDILFAYLVTDMAKEIFMDNSRQYGNGLVKFEPNDLNKGKVVDLRLLTESEKQFIYNAYDGLQNYDSISDRIISLVDKFFRQKYSSDCFDLSLFVNNLKMLIINAVAAKPSKSGIKRFKQLNLFELFDQYGEVAIVNNNIASEPASDFSSNCSTAAFKKNCLICLVERVNSKQFENRTALFYNIGKKFPKAIALNQLFYFVPYIHGKGIRDLYIVKKVRISSHNGEQHEEDANDLSLLFEIVFSKQLYDDYKPAELKIWSTFAETAIENLIDLN